MNCENRPYMKRTVRTTIGKPQQDASVYGSCCDWPVSIPKELSAGANGIITNFSSLRHYTFFLLKKRVNNKAHDFYSERVMDSLPLTFLDQLTVK